MSTARSSAETGVPRNDDPPLSPSWLPTTISGWPLELVTVAEPT
jgi:hypothetical protein